MNANNKHLFLQYIICLTLNLFKTFQECQIFHKMQYDLKGHPRSYKTTFMLKSFFHIRLWTDCEKKLYEYEDTIFT